MRLNPVFLILVLLAGLTASSALADPPTRVGRISLSDGALSLRHAGDPAWWPAAANTPMIMGDSLWVDQASRGEVEIGAAEIRLDRQSEMTLLRLDDQTTQIQLEQGALNLNVRFMPPGELQLVTSVGTLTIFRPGEYHVDAGRPNGPPTQLLMAVLDGEARFSGPVGTAELHSGQGAMVPPDLSGWSVVAVMPTAFDRWAEDRAASQQVTQSSQYVASDMTGTQDLDAYGSWEPVGDYGAVWFPASIPVGWAPYRFGHWAFVRPWGWTWIDEQPWGFAPFHYGRWASFDGRWGWLPGDRRERPLYAPALVAFTGDRGAGIGWVPLGPHERFHPYYQASDGYEHGINRSHEGGNGRFETTAKGDQFVNHAAASSVSAGSFTGGQPVHQNLAPPSGGRTGQAPVLGNLDHVPPPVAATGPALPRPQTAPAAAVAPPASPPPQARFGVAAPNAVPPPAPLLPRPATPMPAVQPPRPSPPATPAAPAQAAKAAPNDKEREHDHR